MSEQIKYSLNRSFVDSSFFTHLSDLKLNELKLNKDKIPIYGYYDFRSLSQNQESSILLNDSSYSTDLKEFKSTLPADSTIVSRGEVLNVNTIDEFKEINKQQYLYDNANLILKSIKDKSFLSDLSLLSKFSILSFADLKKFKFFYWCCFPSLHTNWTISSKIESVDLKILGYLNDLSTIDAQFFIVDESNDKLNDFKNLFDYSKEKLKILFIDTSTLPDSFSYTLRNLLTALALHNYKDVSVSIFRFNTSAAKSYTLNVKLNEAEGVDLEKTIKFVGWERTGQGKLGPKLADLGAVIDPIQLANQSIDLNLKLIKWRILPQLNLDEIQNTKVLLLGSGTLGTYISRGLLSWGIRKITFVDNGSVSFSNPVRQSLYNFDDCLNGGKPKSTTAAEALKKIFPLVDAQGYQLEIPMIGHPITNEAKQKKDYEKLVELIEAHDVIFLLVDSRESRWLPTIIGNVKDKVVFNVALGFESYLVMRHGAIDHSKPMKDQEEDERLGCYFCNDVVAPSDSLKDRTLDQMCTVTRPGVAIMASAIAIELLVSVLQHPRGKLAGINENTILGSVPHQVRGFLHNFENIKLSSKSYKYCSGCSIKVLEEYRKRGWDFVKDSLNDHQYIEKLTGLEEVQRQAEEALLDLDIIDSDEDELN